jgi:hypothetical protein
MDKIRKASKIIIPVILILFYCFQHLRSLNSLNQTLQTQTKKKLLQRLSHIEKVINGDSATEIKIW